MNRSRKPAISERKPMIYVDVYCESLAKAVCKKFPGSTIVSLELVRELPIRSGVALILEQCGKKVEIWAKERAADALCWEQDTKRQHPKFIGKSTGSFFLHQAKPVGGGADWWLH